MYSLSCELLPFSVLGSEISVYSLCKGECDRYYDEKLRQKRFWEIIFEAQPKKYNYWH